MKRSFRFPLRCMIAAAAGLLLVHTASAQLVVSAARPFAVSPRGFALADAYCADWTDVASMYGNPGALGSLRQKSVMLTHHVDWATRTATEMIAAPIMLNDDIAFGVAGMVGRQGVLTGLDGLDHRFSYQGGDVAGSYRLLPTLTVGVLAGVRAYSFGDHTMSTGWAHVGVLYTPSPGITYGIAYRVRGSAVRVIANQDASLVRESTWPADLEIGAAMTFPARSGTPIVSLALTTEKSFPAVQRFNTKGGLEIYPVRFLALRMGYKVGSTTNVARYGAGVLVNRFRLDFGVAPSAAEDRSHTLSVSYLL